MSSDDRKPNDAPVDRDAETADGFTPPGEVRMQSIPERIGRFRIKRLIGAGGMGTVYEAIQETPRRVVALKVLKSGVVSRSSLRRFEYESQILSHLRHPHILQVYEAGTHDDGSGGVPYFATEYIPGHRTITAFAVWKKLGVRERLRLFQDVCSAVHHAHQKGIIHRDLKPDNIVVDSSGHLKIIDFGVARATDRDLAVTTMQTDIGQLIGTLHYMSPEQCDADPHDLDTRSDVYSLGVVLYELLCERLPYELERSAVHEAVRVIREESPRRPSAVSQDLRGDLETIVLKALEKDRDRRYQSALELRSDIERYLHDEPITARPPSMLYAFQKFARRNRAAVIAAAVVMIALIGGVVASSIFALREAEQRRVADGQKAKADQAAAALAAQNTELEKANQNLADALVEVEARERDLRVVTDFQSEMLMLMEPQSMGQHLAEAIREDLIEQIERAEYPAADAERLRTTLNEILARVNMTNVAISNVNENLLAAAEQQIRTRFADHAEIKASLLQSLIEVRCALRIREDLLSTQEEVLALREAALGPDDPATLMSLDWLGRVQRLVGEREEALKTHQRFLAELERLHSEVNPEVLEAMNQVGLDLASLRRDREALDMARAGLAARKAYYGPEHVEVFSATDQLVIRLTQLGEYNEALPLADEALQLAEQLKEEEPKATIYAHNTRGSLMRRMGKEDDAIAHFRSAYRQARAAWGDDSDLTATILGNLAGALVDARQFDEAERLTKEALESTIQAIGETHPSAIIDRNNFGAFYNRIGEHEKAVSILLPALEDSRNVNGDGHPTTIDCLGNIGSALLSLRRPSEALPYCEEALSLSRDFYGNTHEETLGNMRMTGSAHLLINQPDQALALFREAIDGARANPNIGEADHIILSTQRDIGSLLRRIGRLEESEETLRELIATFREWRPGEWAIGVFLNDYGWTLVELKRFEDAKRAFDEAFAVLEPVDTEHRTYAKNVIEGMVHLYTRWHESDPAAGHDSEAQKWQSILDPAGTGQQPAGDGGA